MAKPPAARKFEAEDAVPSASSLLIGLSGASGGGKTFSALRLATGIQRVTGGDIYFVDTDNRRALHYARQFRFKHVNFEPPFSSDAYVQAIEFCEKAGAGVIVVDSMSHEHEGAGGLLEAHEAELDRMAGADYRKREQMKMLAWAAPKQARKRLILKLQRLRTPAILCFRAKETAKPVRVRQDDGTTKTEVVAQGFRPIAGDELVFEMTLNALLYPNSGGVATWQSPTPGEAQMIKLPEQFKTLRERTAPLDEDLGESFATWAAGPAGAKARPPAQAAARAPAKRAAAERPADPAKAATPSPSQAAAPSDDGFPGDRPPPGRAPAETPAERRARQEAELAARVRERGGNPDDPAMIPAPAEAEAEPVDDGAPAAPLEDDPPAEDPPAADGFAVYADAVADAPNLDAILYALAELRKAPQWKADAVDRKRAAWRIGYKRFLEVRQRGDDPASIPHLFRCYIEGETDPDALTGNWQTARVQPEFRAIGSAALAVFEDAVADRLAAIAAPSEAFA